MVETYVEREVKLDVDERFSLPDLGGLVPAGGTLDDVVLHIDSTYFDTAAHDLLRANVTLRRRAGDVSDKGWQLKVPAQDARTELRLPPTLNGAVPKELRDLTGGLRRGRVLRQLARIRTERHAYRVLGVSGELLVEVAEDRVQATTLGTQAVISAWREVEVETGSGDPALVRAILKRLRKAGARPADSSSKLARAVAEPASDAATPSETPTGRATTGDLVIDYLLAQRSALHAGDLELRGGSDAVHRTRVATRRIRSTLRTFRVFEPERAAALDGELAWYAGLLGAVRDPDVLREHLRGVIADLPDHLVLGPVASRVEQHLIGERERARRAVLRALNGRRYFALLDALDEWLADPPFTAAAQDADQSAPAWAKRAQKALERRLRMAASAEDDPEAVHRARKAAKRARYAYELAAPVLAPKLAARAIERATAIQDRLGRFQDSLVACETLLLLGIEAGTSPSENGFTYGLLYALEQRRAEVSLHRVVSALKH